MPVKKGGGGGGGGGAVLVAVLVVDLADDMTGITSWPGCFHRSNK